MQHETERAIAKTLLRLLLLDNLQKISGCISGLGEGCPDEITTPRDSADDGVYPAVVAINDFNITK